MIETAAAVSEEFLDDLEEFIDNAEVEELGITAEDNFAITTREQANYALREYKKLEAKKADLEEFAKERIETYKRHVTDWKDQEVNKILGTMEWFSMRLQTYAQEMLKDSKKKSLPLPEGSLSIEKSRSIDYDEDALMAFLNANDNFHQFINEKVTKTIDKTALKKAGDFDNDGILTVNDVVIPGIKKDMSEVFKIK